MLPNGYRFRPPWWGLLLAALGCGGGLALGEWQSGRAEEKRAAARRMEPVSVTGTFAAKYTVLLDNKVRQGRAGYEVITPLGVKGSDSHVLVNRGWIAAGPSRDVLPALRTPAGEVRIEGVELRRIPRVLQAGKPGGGKVRQNLDIDAFSSETGLTLQTRVIEQHSPLDDGLVRDWPLPEAGAEKHDAYALQWYLLAVLSLVLFLVLNLKIARAKS